MEYHPLAKFFDVSGNFVVHIRSGTFLTHLETSFAVRANFFAVKLFKRLPRHFSLFPFFFLLSRKVTRKARRFPRFSGSVL